jgi:hypothetical protein
MRRPLLSLVVAVAAGCGGAPPAGHMRFYNQPPAMAVNDRRDVKEKPAEQPFDRFLNRFDTHYHRRLTRWMEVRAKHRAANVNSIDEVPDSTWFTNRIGVRDLSIEELRRGPNVTGSPEAHLPLTIKSSKAGGTAPGFIVEDQRGTKYLLKFDEHGFPEAETGTDVIAQRFMWAAGYNVPEDYVIYVKRDQLVMAKDAVVKTETGDEQPMTQEFLERQLARVQVEEDGSIRALASKYLDGVPVGGHPREGIRSDDPNDRIPVEDRRETRGAYAITSWIDHTDIKADNTIDMYVEDPVDPKVHYLVHYWVDFGKALGVQGLIAHNRRTGHSYHWDVGDMGRSLVTLGLWRRPWEGRRFPEHIVGVGVFESRSFYPGTWKANSPTYIPFHDHDRFDGFWGAKIVMRFTPAQIRTIVEQGRFSDPRAVEYITKVLIERQQKVGRYWFDRVAPLDRFAIERTPEAYQLCFEDLALRYGIAGSPSERTAYRLRAFDREGRELAWRGAMRGAAGGHTCGAVPLAAARDGYTIIRIDIDRPGRDLPGVLVHLARTPRTGEPRIIGLRRR